nr:hypothetical protein [Tanacetum cinerariifolium]
LANSIVVASPAIDHVPSAKETDPFETDEFSATPLPPRSPRTKFVAAFTYPSPPSPLTPLAPPLLQIPSPPIHVPSPPLPVDSPTYAEAPLGCRAARIRLRADIPEADMPPRKRLLLTAPTPRLEIGESYAATHPGSTVAHVYRRKSLEFYSRHQEAQEDRATVRDKIEVSKRERLAYERESNETR